MTYTGLSDAQAVELQATYGSNVLPEKKPPTDAEIILEQLKSPLVYILLIAGAVTFFLHEYEDTVIIMISVILNTLLGRYQESKAGKALQALKEMLQPTIKVIRNSAVHVLQTRDLVPGDVVYITAGEKIPADGKILESMKLMVSEAMLTGESLPIEKRADDMVYMGTVVLSGHAYACLEKIGAQTELGKIAVSLQNGETTTPLQKQLAYFSKQLTRLVVIIVFIVVLVGLIRHQPLLEIFTTAVALAVGAIPEGLLVALTVVLTIGMKRILDQKGLVKNLVSAETLGGVTVICSDKTGTLTHGTMEVTQLIGDEKSLGIPIIRTNVDENAVAQALTVRSQQLDNSLISLAHQGERIDSMPFSSEYKYSATVWHDESDEYYLYAMGAPEYLLQRVDLSSQEKKNITDTITTMTESGYRLVACIQKKLSQPVFHLDHKEVSGGGATWLGIVCLNDPIREDVKEALQKTHEAGIKLIVVTGDYPGTARAIMKQLGVDVDPSLIMTGDTLAEMSEQELDLWLEQDGRVKLFARTRPEQKMRIIQALKDDGEVVAMMGDGVNDAPALKKADIGIVVAEATEVAKESADLVLLNSSFSTIVSAVEEGRAMFDNIRKIVLYLLCDAFEEIIVIIFCILLAYPLPVTASQILWINLISDGFPNLALTIDPKRKGLMHLPPRSPQKRIVDSWVKKLIIIVSLTGAFVCFLIFTRVRHTTGSIDLARSVAFVTLGVNSLIYVFSVKTLDKPFRQDNIFNNKRLLCAVLGGLLLQFLPFVFAPLGDFLDLVWIGSWIRVPFVAAGIMFLVIEGYKYFTHKKS